MTAEPEPSRKVVKRWRLGAGGFGVLTASVLVCFGIPLPILLGILVAIVAITFWKKDPHLLFWGFFCSLGLPVLLLVALSTAHYISGSVHLPGDCLSIDRPEQVCFDDEYRAFRSNRRGINYRLDLWSEQTFEALQSFTLRTLIDLFGPSPESYQGPYIPRHEAQDFLYRQGREIDLETIAERPDDDTVRQLLRNHCQFVFHDFPLRSAQHRFVRSQVSDSEPERRCFQRALEDPENHRVYIHEVEERLLVVGTSNPWIAAISDLMDKKQYPIGTIVLIDTEDGRVIDFFLYRHDE